ncbi:MAG TPA: SWIM zinc finger family protein, partial [Methanocorpusculum sp.]|nr:SWIM zinc finger family protein [Methanocorpusculum sp.]
TEDDPKSVNVIYPCNFINGVRTLADSSRKRTVRADEFRSARFLEAPPVATPRITSVPGRNSISESRQDLTEFERHIMHIAEEGARSALTKSNFNSIEQSDIEEEEVESILDMLDLTFVSPEQALACYSRLTKDKQYLVQTQHAGDALFYRCAVRHCKAFLALMFNGSSFKVITVDNHTCTQHSKTNNQELDEYIKELGKQANLGESYFDKVRAYFKDPALSTLRIRRRYNKMFNLTKNQRLDSWRKLPGLVKQVIDDGGTGLIELKNDQVHFAAIMPSFIHQYVSSSIFFGVIVVDGSFHCGIGRGQLLACVTLTGSRKILPIIWGWATTESKKKITQLFSLFRDDERKKVLTVISDSGSAILSAVKDVFGDIYGLCSRHKQGHLSKKCSPCFWKMMRARTPSEYKVVKESFAQRYPDDMNKIRWDLKYMSKFEMDRPMDDLLTNGVVESFNSVCKKWRNDEPYDLLKNIYCYARDVIIDLINDTSEILTTPSRMYMVEAAQVAGRLKLKERVSKNIMIYSDEMMLDYQVDLATNTCSCKGMQQTGLPCPHLIAALIMKGRGWIHLVHPRYVSSEIRAVFPDTPKIIDFTEIVPDDRDIHPPKKYSLVSRKKRQLGAIDHLLKRKKVISMTS